MIFRKWSRPKKFGAVLKQSGRFVVNVVIAIGGILLALLIIEGGLRVFSPDQERDAQQSLICSDELGWRGKPNFEAIFTVDGYEHTVSHNSVGMHDTAHQRSKPPDTFRILMLGDSFIRAAHVHETETAHQVLEDLLNERNPTKQFEVISAGMTGWGTGQELIYYRNEGRLYNPDLVLLMFYIGNDVQDNLPGNALTLNEKNCYAPYFAICNGQLDPGSRFFAPGLSPLMDQCSFGTELLSGFIGKLHLYSQLYSQIEPLLTKNQLRPDKLPYYPLYIAEENDVFDHGWQLTTALIKQLHQEVKRDDTQFAVVLIGPADIVNSSIMDVDTLEKLYPQIPNLRKIQPDLPFSRLSGTLTKQGIHHLNLQPLFIQHLRETGENLYFSRDKHWNVAGNRFTAEALYGWLSELDYLELDQEQQSVSP